MEKSLATMLTELRIVTRSRNKERIKALLPEIRQLLPIPLDQEEFAAALGIYSSTIQKWETGVTVPSISLPYKIEKLIIDRAKDHKVKTLSLEELEYLVGIARDLKGPLPLDMALGLIELRKKE